MLIDGTDQQGFFADYAISDEHGFAYYTKMFEIDETVKKFFIACPERRNFKLKEWILKYDQKEKQKKLRAGAGV